MDGTNKGYHVDEGAYENYARQVDPLGDDVRSAGDQHVGPHVELGGDGFSAMGGESGFAGAYSGRMRALHDRVNKIGGNWHQVGEASRRTGATYAAVEGEQHEVMRGLGKGLA
ncbi:hypothetical protein [Amycolatopsis sp. H20-H5]|uniref:hypothetical protein n=1 Tax=Amycolatopsis sp. H20-H5 TaxID=3046309 RepID=UPI002DBFD5D8|nr:hypothetical protein [Amycolatopsis sp. H20-H5]MEC3978481.1 hypothetical protein [Amycolatopsis sp. H20-H5]